MEKWYSFFNKCENDLLQNIDERRQYKLRGIETNITELKSSLLPFSNQSEYKEKDTQLQEIIKKYDIEVQAKKQKKFKRDILDYMNKKVYKWQVEDKEPLGIDDQWKTTLVKKQMFLKQGGWTNTPPQV